MDMNMGVNVGGRTSVRADVRIEVRTGSDIGAVVGAPPIVDLSPMTSSTGRSTCRKAAWRILPLLALLLMLPIHSQANTANTAATPEADTLAVYYRKARIVLDEFDPPSSALLVASGALGLMVARRRQRKDSL